MSIILKDGTMLPDLPDDVLAEYPYAIIIQTASDIPETAAMFSKKPFAYGSIDFFASVGLSVLAPSIGTLSSGVAYELDGTWTTSGSFTPESSVITAEGGIFNLVWSNHNIMVVQSANLSTMTAETNGEVYFAVDDVLALKDGTKLIAPTADCFDETPYGMVVSLSGGNLTLYSLVTSEKPIAAVPENMLPSGTVLGSDDTHGTMAQTGKWKRWIAGEEWSLSDEKTTEKLDALYILKSTQWSNHDLCETTEVSSDGSSYKVGSTVVRKSDVNYRITDGWMKSIANEARRLGSVTGSMKPDVVESTLRATTTGADFSEATLISNGALLSGVKAYGKDGVLYTGTIPIRKPEDITTDGARTVVPWGYYANGLDRTGTAITQATPNISVNSNGVITATSTQSTSGYMEAGTKSQTYTLSDSDDSNFKASNIKSGVTIFGVTGSYEGEESLDDILYEEFIDVDVNSNGQIELTTMHDIETLISFGFTLSCGQYDRQAYISASGNYSKDCTLHLITTDSNGENMSHETQRATVYKNDDVVRIDTDIGGLINANIMGSFVVYTTQNS